MSQIFRVLSPFLPRLARQPQAPGPVQLAALPAPALSEPPLAADRAALETAGLHAAQARQPSGNPNWTLDLQQVLARSESALRRAHRMARVNEPRVMTPVPTDQWLLDNYYVLQEQVKECRLHLKPAAAGQRLPLTAEDGAPAAPRIFILMRDLVAQRRCQLASWMVRDFLVGVQQQAVLTLDELWFVPIMLRLALLEQLADVVRGAYQRPDRKTPPAPAARAAAGTRAAAIMADAIGSLRALARANWSDLVEHLSRVEQTLRRDAAGIYEDMDFSTRALYRHAVVQLAERSQKTELAVAQAALTASEQVPAGGEPAARHVGYWLMGPGRAALAQQLGVRERLLQRLGRWFWRWPSAVYLGAIGIISLDVAWLVLDEVPAASVAHKLLIAVLLFVAASHLAVALVNWLATLALPPSTLPRMDFSAGVPARWRTLVVMPCMLGSRAEIDTLLAALEQHRLGNRDANLFYALVTDFLDAPQQHMPGDTALAEYARAGIEALNAQYGVAGTPPPFALLHRQRRYNAAEGVWMGWERKRGKLIALNRFLRGQRADDVHLLAGDAIALQGTAFVITLDADTRLPPEAAQRLVATLAHPLNRPVWSARKRRVVRGYSILQPRVSVGAMRGEASLLARLYSDEITLDPYTGTVSDVYQDLFGEASYIGKGIYDVDWFLHSVGERFPDNLILSHDLLEGSHARAGLVSDIELFEYHPDNYLVDMRRRHRWTRGDWQIWPWLLPRVPGRGKKWQRNPLSSHQRWKLLDNLRRSLVPAALLLLLLNGWLLTARPLGWTLVVILVLFSSPLFITIDHLRNRDRRMSWRTHWHLVREAGRRRLLQAALPLVMLPYEAALYLHAMVISQWRMWVTRRLRLQWTPAGTLARSNVNSKADFYRIMWIAPALAAAILPFMLWFALHGRLTLLAVLPLPLLWLAAPWIAWRLSVPMRRTPQRHLTLKQRRWLRMVARHTWHFFEVTVTPQSYHLPPDNFQEIPKPQIAQRTSPTNIGMYLLSCLSAWDSGYLTRPQLLQRVAQTLDTLDQLPRFKGHFYNWYSTATLEPLPPTYVSTVDSGNFIACMLVLARGLQMLDEEPLMPAQAWRGLQDTWQVVRERAAQGQAPVQSVLDLVAEDVQTVDALLHEAATPLRLADRAQQLRTLTQALGHMQGVFAAALPAAEQEQASPGGARHNRIDDGVQALQALQQWLESLQTQCAAWADVLHHGAPWLALMPSAEDSVPDAAAAVAALGGAAPLKTLRQQLQQLLDEPAQSQTDAATDAAASASDAACRASLQQGLDWHQANHRLAQTLAARCRALAQVDFDFLYAPEHKLLTIGYHPDSGTQDAGLYDLLASEARLGSFVAIAQGKLPLEHWLAFGRLLASTGQGAALLSWSGSMFEYLMPQLVVPAIENTLLTRSCHNVIARQIAYGRQRGVPWGISESAYNRVDGAGVYQYHPFGVPGLGLRRGLEKDLVVAPYATALAFMLRPRAALRNLQRLAQLGALGRYGFYEALDFTPGRRPAGADFALVRAYMAHHQGMSFNALSAVLNDAPMQRRFMREPMFAAYRLLLEEKIPAAFNLDAHALQPAGRRAPARLAARG